MADEENEMWRTVSNRRIPSLGSKNGYQRVKQSSESSDHNETIYDEARKPIAYRHIARRTIIEEVETVTSFTEMKRSISLASGIVAEKANDPKEDTNEATPKPLSEIQEEPGKELAGSIEEIIEELNMKEQGRVDELLQKVKTFLAIKRVEEFEKSYLVCYGVGHFDYSIEAQRRLALFVLLGRKLEFEADQCLLSTYKLTDQEREAIAPLGLTSLAHGKLEMCTRRALSPTIFFMPLCPDWIHSPYEPYCPDYLYHNLLRVNWSKKRLVNTCIVGLSLSDIPHMHEHPNEEDVDENMYMIYFAEEVCTETSLTDDVGVYMNVKLTYFKKEILDAVDDDEFEEFPPGSKSRVVSYRTDKDICTVDVLDETEEVENDE